MYPYYPLALGSLLGSAYYSCLSACCVIELWNMPPRASHLLLEPLRLLRSSWQGGAWRMIEGRKALERKCGTVPIQTASIQVDTSIPGSLTALNRSLSRI
ncbi:hypothetical protein LX36DRAFT_59287 [Colletotrichum falcatum]|nr:hypothetical protein LX36DRAFT_59287 [Colletotrichum falcatum]